MESRSSRSSTKTSPSISRRSKPTRAAWWSFATRCEGEPHPAKRAVELVVASSCSMPAGTLLLASPQAADFILARQAEREERAGGLKWTHAETRIGEDN